MIYIFAIASGFFTLQYTGDLNAGLAVFYGLLVIACKD